jgi:hypothetical protein
MHKGDSASTAEKDQGMDRTKLTERLEQCGQRPSSLKTLFELYTTDRECFFELATTGVSDEAPSWIRSLAQLAAEVRSMVRQGFESHPRGNRVQIRSRRHSYMIGSEDASAIMDFLHELNGTALVNTKGRDYAGRHITKAEVEFKVGKLPEPLMSDEQLTRWLHSKPIVLQLAEEDRRAVTGGMPGYVVYALKYCAPHVVHSPTVVFEGLRHEGELVNGRAYCGIPPHAYDNDGNKSNPKANMVFVVYTNSDGFVFDWDWVKQGSLPGYPVDWQERFERKLDEVPDAVLTGLEDIHPTAFTPSHAWFSQKGDCVFWYKLDAPAYADRIHDEFTVFKTFDGGHLAGCKLKNISMMLSELSKAFEESQPDSDFEVLLTGSLFLQTTRGKPAWREYKHLLGHLFGNGGVVVQNLELREQSIKSDSIS